MWIQPVKWKRGEELPKDPEREDGHRLVTYSVFFMTPYSGSGYMGLERMTSVYLQGDNAKDFFLFWSALFPKVQNASTSARFLWPAGEWHHVALTWKGQEITLYLDGERACCVPLKGKIDVQPATFIVGGSGADPTLIDEVAIYSRALSEKDVKDLFTSFKN